MKTHSFPVVLLPVDALAHAYVLKRVDVCYQCALSDEFEHHQHLEDLERFESIEEHSIE